MISPTIATHPLTQISLPPEILQKNILSRLSRHELFQFAMSCRQGRDNASGDVEFWKACTKKLGLLPKENMTAQQTVKEYYQRFVSLFQAHAITVPTLTTFKNPGTQYDRISELVFLPQHAALLGDAFVAAAKRGDVEAARLLCRLLGTNTTYQKPAFFEAVKANQTAVLEVLLEDASISNETQKEALLEAAGKGHGSTVELLLASGAISKEDRGTAMYRAAEHGHITTVEMLLERGPVSTIDLQYAFKATEWSGHFLIARMLCEAITKQTRNESSVSS